MGRWVDRTSLPKPIVVLAVLVLALLWLIADVLNVLQRPWVFAGSCLVSVSVIAVAVLRAYCRNCPPWVMIAINALNITGAVLIWTAGTPWGLGGWPFVVAAAIASFTPVVGYTIAGLACLPMLWSVFHETSGNGTLVVQVSAINRQYLIFTLVMVIGLVAVEVLQRNYRELQASQTLLAEVVTQNERNRIMRDLHDEVGHSLVQTSVQMDLVEMLIQREEYGSLGTIVHQVGTDAREILMRIRSVIYGMQTLDLGRQIKHSAHLLTSAGVHVEEDVRGPVEVGPADAVYAAILQEVVTNILRHSQATRVRITLEGRRLVVEDNGVGFDPDDRAGLGMAAMNERAAEVGLNFRVGTSPDLSGALIEIAPVAGK